MGLPLIANALHGCGDARFKKKKAARWLNLAAFKLAFGGAGGI
jgi:hypothetical protein